MDVRLRSLASWSIWTVRDPVMNTFQPEYPFLDLPMSEYAKESVILTEYDLKIIFLGFRRPFVVQPIARTFEPLGSVETVAADQGWAIYSCDVLIHDSASGPIDFSGPRCIFPFRSSGFHEPAYFGAYARPRVLIVSPSLAYYYYYYYQ
jgi:hypothetical protein